MSTPTKVEDNVDCCIAGGGPAGMMLGFLLARTGLKVVVLEKHADFFRDFRGDTIHPSTIQIMDELGLLDEFLKVPHQEVTELKAIFNDFEFTVADFSHLSVKKPVLGLMPQWDFLNFVAAQAAKYPTFKLIKEANVTGLLRDGKRITGVEAKTPDGVLQVKAKLTIGADGRSSIVRELAGVKVIKTGAPIDVLWFRLSQLSDDPSYTLGRFSHGNIMILLNRKDYWQCAYVIEKGDHEKIQMDGLENYRKQLASVSPFLTDRLIELKNWDDIKLLSVEIDHLEKWYDEGLLCIGDAAHAMSPIGGVGINLAIQDAVAAANILYPHFSKAEIDVSVLKQVQDRRECPTRVIQKVQVIIQGIIRKGRGLTANTKPPLLLRMLNLFPILRRIPARLVGLGIRPEHIRTPDVNKNANYPQTP